jgi:manganese/zinc/iron transport system permease protein
MGTFLGALLLQSGYNAAVVAIGAALLGAAAGTSGVFLFLRRRALASDAIAHATLPGVGVAFLVMVAAGGDGRTLAALLAGAAVSAALGLLLVDAIVRRTRLAEDTAIGAVLSVFFGLGIVLLTIIQSVPAGRAAGLEGFLLGATAGMLLAEAVLIAAGGALVVGLVLLLRRPMTRLAFDPGFVAAGGGSVRRTDLAIMGLVLAVTVVGLKVVGLVLIVALLIIPPVTARLWTDRIGPMLAIAGGAGAVAGYVGSALSASAPSLPTGPVIVLVAVTLFAASLLVAPRRGVLAALLRHRRFQTRVHLRQGLLALARAEPIFDPLTLRVLRRAGLIRADGVATEAGRAEAARALRDEKRWEVARSLHPDEAVIGRYDGLSPVDSILTRDEIAEIDRRIGPPAEVPA